MADAHNNLPDRNSLHQLIAPAWGSVNLTEARNFLTTPFTDGFGRVNTFARALITDADATLSIKLVGQAAAKDIFCKAGVPYVGFILEVASIGAAGYVSVEF